MVIKTQLCAFSEYRMYPSIGRCFFRKDGQVIWLSSSKAISMYHQKKKPQKLAWTMAWRRMHKKATDSHRAKRRTRKIVKVQRAVVGISKDDLARKKTENKSKRNAARELNVKAIKERKKLAKQQKKAQKKLKGGKTSFTKMPKDRRF